MKISRDPLTLIIGLVCLYLIFLGIGAALAIWLGGAAVIALLCPATVGAGCIFVPPLVGTWLTTVPWIMLLVFLLVAMPLTQPVDKAFGTHISAGIARVYKRIPIVNDVMKIFKEY